MLDSWSLHSFVCRRDTNKPFRSAHTNITTAPAAPPSMPLLTDGAGGFCCEPPATSRHGSSLNNGARLHRYFCRRLMRLLLLLSRHPHYDILLEKSEVERKNEAWMGGSQGVVALCYCQQRINNGGDIVLSSDGGVGASTNTACCWCLSGGAISPTPMVGVRPDCWEQIRTEIFFQEGGGGRVSNMELVEALSRAGELYSKRYAPNHGLNDDAGECCPTPQDENKVTNPIPNVVELPCEPSGAFVLGPTRGHALDTATVLLEQWLRYPQFVEDALRTGVHPDVGEWVLDCVYLRLRATEQAERERQNQRSPLTTSEDARPPTAPPPPSCRHLLPDLVMIGSFIDDGQQSCEMLALLSWLSLALLKSPQCRTQQQDEPEVEGATSSTHPDNIPSLPSRDRAAFIRGPHELLFPISSQVTSHFVGRLDEELRLRFGLSPGGAPSTLPPNQPSHSANATFAKSSHERRSPHAPPLEPNELQDEDTLPSATGVSPRNVPGLHPLLVVRLLPPADGSEMGDLQLVPGSEDLQIESERLAYALLDLLPVAAVLQGKYFCVSGGIPSSMRTIDELQHGIGEGGRAIGGDDEGVAFEQLCELMFSDPMGDDDERRLGHLAMFASNFERGLSHVYSFNAVCRFLRANDLVCVIRGNTYTSHRFSQATNQMGRPWWYQYSPNDPGYQCYRTNPDTGYPSIISLFSAPQFCSQNNNFGAYLVVPPAPSLPHRPSFSKRHQRRTQSVEIHQFQAAPRRPLQLPGTSVSAFSWCQSLLGEFLYSAVTNMLGGDQVSDDDDGTQSNMTAVGAQHKSVTNPVESDQAAQRWMEAEVKSRVVKFHRLCQLLHKEGLPLPSLSLLKGEIDLDP